MNFCCYCVDVHIERASPLNQVPRWTKGSQPHSGLYIGIVLMDVGVCGYVCVRPLYGCGCGLLMTFFTGLSWCICCSGHISMVYIVAIEGIFINFAVLLWHQSLSMFLLGNPSTEKFQNT